MTYSTWSRLLANKEPNQQIPSRIKRYSRLLLVLAIVVLLNLGGIWLGQLVNFQLFPRHDPMLHAALLVVVAVYTLLMAIPFMPGIEVGLAVILLLGPKSALLIYLCTLLALSISYLIGKCFPLTLVQGFLDWLYLHRASDLVRQLEPLDRLGRLQFLHDKAPARLAPFLLHHRYLTIAALLNLPGNALIGGGGGIGLVVGMSKVIPFYKYFLLISVAVAPLPLFLYLQAS